LEAVQDVFSMPATVYVPPSEIAPEPSTDDAAPTAAARVIERPYAWLAGELSSADLSALSGSDGYLMAVASPAGAELGFTLHTEAGDGFQAQDDAGWSGTAIAATDTAPLDTEIGIEGWRDLGDAAVGMWVFWDAEICRLDAIDLSAGSLTLARGCV